jgi:hypothetical protein
VKGQLPETASKRDAPEHRRWPVLLIVGMLLALALWAIGGSWFFEPGEELGASQVKDIAVSEEDTLYPPSDVVRFGERPGAVYVYLAVEGLRSGTELEARVERSGRGSLLSRLVSGREEIEVRDGQEEQLSPSEGGVAGVVKFELRAGSGGRLPAGGYTVEVYEAGEETPVAAKRFVVRG